MQTDVYNPIDITIKGGFSGSNPFFAQIEGRFRSPDGDVLRVPGFYAGGDRWIIRFSPTTPGNWEYTVRSTDIPKADGTTGEVTVKAPSNPPRGVLRVSESFPLHFAFEDGTHHFMNAYECDWLWALDLESGGLEKTGELVRQIKKYNFNTVIMNVFAYDSNWTPGKTSEYDYGPPAMYAWEGSNDEPEHSRINTAFFDHLDKVIHLLYENDLMVHLFFKVYNKMVNYPDTYSPEDDLYFKYITARYQAYPNITWDFSKESKNEPDKDYLFNRLSYIRSLDAYRHMVTTHDDPGYFTTEARRRSVDFFTAQQHTNFYYSALVARERYKIPYFNSEFGYEHGQRGVDDVTYSVSTTPEQFIERAYEVVMAGGYPAYYYTYTAWDVIDYRYEPPGCRYFKILYDFFTSIEWWKFDPSLEMAQPNSALCLTKGEEELVVFPGIRDRERAGIFMTGPLEYAAYEGFWMDIFSGERVEVKKGSLQKNAKGLMNLTIPFPSKTGVLYLKKNG